ncbi:MAG: galactose mutarotase, partial [Oscillospiraceae bacterium]|nr:galactose mutarotase [Oscillospiraceae bacterium]
MTMKKELFGTTKCGKEVYLYTLENSKGMKATVMNYGAILVDLVVPDKDGNCADVVLGYDKLEDYYVNGGFFGSVIAPNANRIAGAKFTLNGVEYNLKKNNGENNLHSDEVLGSHKRVWDVEEGDNCVKFSLEMADGDMGFPGNKKISVSYVLTEDNELKLIYTGSSDQDTVFNMTNHSYFNLDGHGAGTIHDHVLTMKATYFT